MSEVAIPKLEDLLLPEVLPRNKSLVSYQTKPLTAPGENYGSLMLQLDIELEDQSTKKQETIHAVAKLIADNEFIRKIFRPELTFRKELGLYETIVPTLQNFQREYGLEVIDCFPKFLGGRLGLQNPQVFDCEAVLLLENLKTSGFELVDRTKGFNLETTQIILKDLAQLHSIPIALRTLKPQVYQTKIVPFLNRVEPDDSSKETWINTAINEFLTIANEDEECRKVATNLTGKFWKTKTEVPEGKKEFKTLVHLDFWVNNTMVKFEDGKPVKNKMVDFQGFAEGSVGADLGFFLFSSLQSDLIKHKLDDLIEYYYSNFIGTLSSFGINTEGYSKDLLYEEIRNNVKHWEFVHCCFMLRPIFASKDTVTKAEDLSMDEMTKEKEATQPQKERLWLMVKECLKRNWL